MYEDDADLAVLVATLDDDERAVWIGLAREYSAMCLADGGAPPPDPVRAVMRMALAFSIDRHKHGPR